MIGFEEQTQPLTAWEQHNLLPVMLAGLRTKVGQDNAVTSGQIIKALKADPYNFKINGARVRKVINYIRLNGMVRNLVASSKGYYIEQDPKAVEVYKQSLRDRIGAIEAVLNSFD